MLHLLAVSYVINKLDYLSSQNTVIIKFPDCFSAGPYHCHAWLCGYVAVNSNLHQLTSRSMSESKSSRSLAYCELYALPVMRGKSGGWKTFLNAPKQTLLLLNI